MTAGRAVAQERPLTPSRLARQLSVSKAEGRRRLDRLVALRAAITREVDLPELKGETVYLIDDEIEHAT